MEEKIKTFTEKLEEVETINEGGEYLMLCTLERLVKEMSNKIAEMDRKINAIYRAEGLGDPRQA